MSLWGLVGVRPRAAANPPFRRLGQGGQLLDDLEEEPSSEQPTPWHLQVQKERLLQAGLCFGCCVLLPFIALVVSVNLITKSALSAAGSYALGTHMEVGSATVNVFSAYSSLVDVAVRSPTGYDHDLVDLERATFDLGFWSLLGHWFTNGPYELQQLSIRGLQVFIEQRLDGSSNARAVLESLHQRLPHHEASPSQLRQATAIQIVADRIELRDISASVDVQGFSGVTGPVSYTIDKVLLQHVGTKNGVPLSTLIQDVVKALLAGVISSANADLRASLEWGFGAVREELQNLPNVSSIYYDAGHGMRHFGQWAAAVQNSTANTLEGRRFRGALRNATKSASGMMAELANATEHAGEAMADLVNSSSSPSSAASGIAAEAAEAAAEVASVFGGYEHGSNKGQEDAHESASRGDDPRRAP